MANLEPQHFDDRPFGEEWQREVYGLAALEFRARGYSTVCDVGCGSGVKLVQRFGTAQTVGFELEPCLSHLRSRWPDREWRHAGELRPEELDADLVICSDVIEHLRDPAALMVTFRDSSASLFVISTPELSLLAGRGLSSAKGPPVNPCHVNEWTLPQFTRFVGKFLKVVRQEISNQEQCTQVVVAQRGA